MSLSCLLAAARGSCRVAEQLQPLAGHGGGTAEPVDLRRQALLNLRSP